MKWIETEIKLKDLKEYEKNPRRISKEQLQRLVKSIEEDGYRNRIVVDTDNVIIGGHARKISLKKAGYKDNDLIPVLMPERKLTEEEFERINIRDNGSFGSFDIDALANFGFEVDKLIDWGVSSSLFAGFAKEEPQEQPNKEKKCPHCGEVIK